MLVDVLGISEAKSRDQLTFQSLKRLVAHLANRRCLTGRRTSAAVMKVKSRCKPLHTANATPFVRAQTVRATGIRTGAQHRIAPH